MPEKAPVLSSAIRNPVCLLSNLSVKVNGTSRELNVDMVPPFSSRTFWIPGNVSANSLNGTVTVTVVNDRGARISERYHVAEG